MDGQELSDLIRQRHATLRELLDVGSRQMEAIEAGRMSELMRLLSGKQSALTLLAKITEKLRSATDDNPSSRTWESEQARLACRKQQDECETMHLELLAIEAECESALQASRASITQRIDRLDAGRQAANRYASGTGGETSGGQLDLSSN